LGKEDPEKPSGRQKQRHVEIKGDFGVGKPSSSEVVVIEKVIEVAAVLRCVNHRAFFLKLLQAFLSALVDFGSAEKGIEEPSQQKPRSIVEDVRI